MSDRKFEDTDLDMEDIQGDVTSSEEVKKEVDELDKVLGFLKDKTPEFVEEETAYFMNSFQENKKIKLFPGKTYFVLGKLLGNTNASDVYETLSKEKILIRNCSNFNGLSDKFIRVSLKDRKTNRMLSEKLQTIL